MPISTYSTPITLSGIILSISSLIPGMNLRFMWTYINETGGFIDVSFEAFQTGTIARSPMLWFYTFFGYFLPPPGNMVVIFARE